MCFGIKNTIKNNRYHTPKHSLKLVLIAVSMFQKISIESLHPFLFSSKFYFTNK